MSKRSKSTKSNAVLKSRENEEPKKQNLSSDREIFLNVCTAFEIALTELKVEDLDEELNNELLKIQNLLQSQILKYKSNSFNSPEDISELEPTKMPESNSSSMLRLCSLNMDLDDNPAYQEFLIRVNCPFCLKLQADKIKLIEHMDESCKLLKTRMFPESKHVPYSVCQILPNNTFKCNICVNSFQNSVKQNFIHNRMNFHITAYESETKKKIYTDFYFCSSCKVLVPDNYTQVTAHIQNEMHKSGSILSTSTYLKDGIHFVYLKSKKFKCLLCRTQNLFETPKKMLQHLESLTHTHNLRPRNKHFGKAYCEYCKKPVNVFEVLMHFTSDEHEKQNKRNEIHTEMCFYCGFTCESLGELATHVEAKCIIINDLRKENLKNKTPKDSKEVAVTVKTDEDSKKENFIIVKDNTEILELYKFFKKFGQITSLEPYQEKNTLIKFREKNSIDDILLLRNYITINGRTVEISTDESVKPNNKEKSSNKSRNSSESSDYDSNSSDNRVNLTTAKELPHDQLQELFQRVSHHLFTNTHRLAPEVKENIIQDCSKVLKVKECSLVGFVGCGLSFSVESISIYCNFENDTRGLLSDLVVKLMTESCFKLLQDQKDPLWEDVTLCNDGCLPQISCTHKKTQSACKITLMRSAKVLTDILSHYLEENPMIGRFCLIIRLWLSVHDLKIKEFEYVIISLLIFFLLNEEIVKPYPNIKQISDQTFLFHKEVTKKVGISKSTKSYENSESLKVKQLFQKFLQLLSEFDFKKQAICLPVKHSIPKEMLTGTFSKYLVALDRDELTEPPMCIVDPLLNVNLASRVEENDLKALFESVRSIVLPVEEEA